MSLTDRFQTKEQWPFVPGPAELSEPLDSQILQEIELHAPAAIAESFLSFPGTRQIRAATASWWEWRARWESADRFIELGMTLFDDEAQSWGGSPILADCSPGNIEALWSHMQARHRGVWMYDSDGIIHTRDSFREALFV
jgi:hypothetical protein